MEIKQAVTALAALAQESRLEIYRYLVQAGQHGMPAGQIGEHFGLPGATLSFHLKSLKQAGLISYEREGRSLIYRADYATINGLLAYLTENCCGGTACGVPESLTLHGVCHVPRKVLFVCIHNSARSQMAEAFLNHFCGNSFAAESAGIEPGKLNPLVVTVMQEIGIDISHKQTRGVDVCLQAGTLYDYVVTVCDETAAERCPVFPGPGRRLHWGFPDPSALTGSTEEKLARTRDIRDQIKTKIESWCREQCQA